MREYSYLMVMHIPYFPKFPHFLSINHSRQPQSIIVFPDEARLRVKMKRIYARRSGIFFTFVSELLHPRDLSIQLRDQDRL